VPENTRPISAVIKRTDSIVFITDLPKNSIYKRATTIRPVIAAYTMKKA
jgi:hypothetical protein